jgi:hypothetical protein
LTRKELISGILAAPPRGDDVVYIERRGEDYAWKCAALDVDMLSGAPGGEIRPDVWIYYSGQWPAEDGEPSTWRAFLDDLLEEMESMAGGKDRCRWPLDEPWPHRH